MKSYILVCLLIPLIACGGGGKSWGPNVPPVKVQSKITAENADDIIRDALGSFEDINDINNFLINDSGAQTFADSTQNKTLLPITFCGDDPLMDTGHGSMDISISGNFITTLNLLVQFNQCEIETAIIADGGFALNFVGVGEIGPGLQEGRNSIIQTFNELSITDNNKNVFVEFDGSLVSVNEFASPIFSWSNLFNFDITSASRKLSFDNWRKNLSFNIENNLLAVTIDGDFSASNQNGGFTFNMVEPLIFEAVLVDNQVDANVVLSGQFKITADNDSSVVATILNPTLAQLDIDEDGDGFVDVSLTIEISELNIFKAIGK